MENIKNIIKRCTKRDKNVSIVSVTLFWLFTIITFSGIFIKPLYDYNDIPIFTCNNLFDLLSLLFWLSFYYFLSRNHMYSQTLNNLIVVVFILFAIIYIYMVPLDVFSDMKMIYQGSIYVCDWNMELLRGDLYFNTNPNNLAICFFYGLLMKCTIKSIFVLKFVNLIMVCLTHHVLIKMVKMFEKQASTLVMNLYLYTFVPTLMYINHIYTDIPFVFLTVCSIYLYLKNKNGLCLGLLAIAYVFRPVAVIFLVAIIIDYLTKNKTIHGLMYGLLLFTVAITCYKLFLDFFLFRNENILPIWSYIYMAFNSQKFGFQDGSHSVTRSFIDVLNRIKEYSFLDFCNIILKKVFWTWNEGTYQAGRYAFGNDVINTTDKFLYETPITKYLLSSHQCGRKILTTMIRGSYMALFIGVIIHWAKNREAKYNVINLCFLGTVLFYCFWEIKSRYIFHLYPYMLMMSYLGFRNIINYKKCKKESNCFYE